MKLLLSCLFLTTLAAGSVRADLSPEKLAAFRIDGSPPLRNFSRARRDLPPPLFDKPASATATLNVRCFHGPSELGYAVLLFPSEAAVREWDRQMRRSSAAWFSPLDKPRIRGVRESRQGGPVRPALPRGRAIVVNRIVIVIGVTQHPEMVRRHPETAEDALSDAALAQTMERVRAELVRRALDFPANR